MILKRHIPKNLRTDAKGEYIGKLFPSQGLETPPQLSDHP